MTNTRFHSESALQDAELVRAAQAGDTASLGILFGRYRAPLLGLAISLVGYRAAAEDAVHDTFVAALTRFGDLKDPAAIGGWLHAILRNRCLMERRTARRRPTAEIDSEIPAEGCFEDCIESSQLREWVWNALSRLPETMRVAMLLRYFASFESYEEIAAILAVPVGTVRSRLFDGKARLGALLLEAAGMGAADQRALRSERREFFFESMQDLFKGRRCDAYFEAHAEDLRIDWSGKRTTRGRHHLQKEIEGGFRRRRHHVAATSSGERQRIGSGRPVPQSQG